MRRRAFILLLACFLLMLMYLGVRSVSRLLEDDEEVAKAKRQQRVLVVDNQDPANWPEHKRASWIKLIQSTYTSVSESSSPTIGMSRPKISSQATTPTWLTASPLATIPPIIHQIFLAHKSLDWRKEVSMRRRPWIQSWATKNPQHKHIVWDGASASKFMRDSFPTEIAIAYEKLPHHVMKGDFLRYALLYHFGGVYTDTDTICEKPISEWDLTFRNASLIVAVENMRGGWNHDNPNQPTQIAQFTMAAAPKHPMLYSILQNITKGLDTEELEGMLETRVMTFTGPFLWTLFVEAHLATYGESFDSIPPISSLRGDNGAVYYTGSRTLILPINSFLADAAWAHDFGVGAPLSFVSHLGAGAWEDGWKREFNHTSEESEGGEEGEKSEEADLELGWPQDLNLNQLL